MRLSTALAAGALVVATAACAPDTAPAPPPPAASPAPTAPAAPAPPADPRAATAPQPVLGPPVKATVTKVTDGDTVHVRTADGQDLDIRVIGENSPEVVDPRVGVQCYGPQASAEAHRVLDGQTVAVRVDPTQGDPVTHKERYGRDLRVIALPGGEDLSVHMVVGGWSRAYKLSRGPAPLGWAALVNAQADAQHAARGLWAPRPAGCGGGL